MSHLLILLRQRLVGYHLLFVLDLLQLLLINSHFLRLQRRGLYKLQVWISDKPSRQSHKRLLELIVALGGNVIILHPVLSVEDYLFGLHFPVSDVHFVAYQHHRYLVTNSHKVFVPLRHVLVSDPGSHIEHDHGALPADIVTVSQPSQLLLPCSVSDIELNRSS